jgi:hypothetical protein
MLQVERLETSLQGLKFQGQLKLKPCIDAQQRPAWYRYKPLKPIVYMS